MKVSHPILTNTFKAELLQGVHQPRDTYKMALYLETSHLDESTDAYTTTGELQASGYRAGGLVLEGRTVRQYGEVSVLTWADAVWPHGSIRARAALIYNASRDDRSIAVIHFESLQQSVNAPFVIEMPVPRHGEGVVVLR